MKKAKLLMVIAMACAVVFLMSGIAQANFAIHGGYLADTDACAGCHRAHTATSAVTWIDNAGARRSALLVGPPTTQVYIFCYVCHSSGAPGAATDVEGGVLDSVSPGGAVEGANNADMTAINKTLNGGGFELLGNSLNRPTTSTHEVKGAAWPAWGKDENVAGAIFMDCVSCHDPHGSSNYRILKDYVNGHWVGGYQNSTTPVTSASRQAATIGGVDPDPLPFVISNEVGYPLKGSVDPYGPIPSNPTGINPTNGFRLHRQYNNADLVAGNYNGGYEYLPAYTSAKYARGENATMINQYDPNKGMSSWCCACHENYMAKTSISTWAIGRVSDGDQNSGTPGNYPLTLPGGYPMQAGTTNVLTTTLSAPITADQLTIMVTDSHGFPNPDELTVADTKYIGIWDPSDQVVETNEGPVGIPKFEMVAYKAITYGTPGVFTVANAGRGAFNTAPQAFKIGAKVYLGYDAGDGYGDLVRHRHPMNVPLSNWQQGGVDPEHTPNWVAGDRALVVDPADWQNFDPSIPVIDIPLDHDAGYPLVDPLSEQGGQLYKVADWIECLTCHRAHGTDATMSGFAGATMLPATIEGFNTLVPNPGQDDGVPPTGDSALLRAPNRGVCERCHNK